MVFPAGIVGVRVGVMVRPRLEVIDIYNLVTRGLAKRTLNLKTQSYMVKRSTTITRRRGGTCIHRINI